MLPVRTMLFWSKTSTAVCIADFSDSSNSSNGVALMSPPSKADAKSVRKHFLSKTAVCGADLLDSSTNGVAPSPRRRMSFEAAMNCLA
ncbi:hypothetical protein TB2_045179 [Malus domestica]